MSYLGNTKSNDYENGKKFLGHKVTSDNGNDTKEKEIAPTDPAATGFGGAGQQPPAVQQQQLPQATAAAGGIPQPPMMHLVNTINGPMLVPVSQNPHVTQPPPPVSSVGKLAYFLCLKVLGFLPWAGRFTQGTRLTEAQALRPRARSNFPASLFPILKQD